MSTTEPVIIVDEQDNVIGTKQRGAITYSDIYRVTGLWVTNGQSQVLLAQRKWDKAHDPGKWGPAVSGTVNEGETYEASIYKEAAEEIGLTGVHFDTSDRYFVDDGQHRFFNQRFTVQIDWPIEAFTIQEEEVEQIVWVDKATLLHEINTTPEKFVPGAARWKKLL